MAQIDIRISIDDRMVRWDDPEFAELLPISSEMLRTLDGQRGVVDADARADHADADFGAAAGVSI